MRPNPEKRSESPDRFCDRLQRICLRSISGTALPLSDQASEKEAFSKVLREAADFLRLHDRRLTFRIRQTMYEIPWGEILYLEGDLRKIHLHTVLGEYTFYGKLEKLKEQLTPGGFFQCHKSYVVNPNISGPPGKHLLFSEMERRFL